MGYTVVMRQPVGVSPTQRTVERASVRHPVFSSLILCLAVGLQPGFGLAQAVGVSQKHHPWGLFKPGAWKLVREVKQTLDEKGLVTCTITTDTRTTLLELGKDGVILERESVHEVAGKRFVDDPETIKQGFHGELLSQDLKIKEAGTAQVEVEGRKIACKILQLDCSGPASKTVTTIYYSPTVAPYVLKRHSVTTDLEGNNSRIETTADVMALDMPYKVLADIQRTAYVKVVQKHPKGSTFTRVIISPRVPGGVVWHGSKELDKAGRLIRYSTLELIDYGLEMEVQRTGLFGLRRKGGLFRKPRPRLLPQ